MQCYSHKILIYHSVDVSSEMYVHFYTYHLKSFPELFTSSSNIFVKCPMEKIHDQLLKIRTVQEWKYLYSVALLKLLN